VAEGVQAQVVVANLDPAVTTSVIAQFAAIPSRSDDLAAKFDELTPREREVLVRAGPRPLERGDRAGTRHQRGNREEPCGAPAGEARPARPRPGSDPGLETGLVLPGQND
jgi:hypothetical protein